MHTSGADYASGKWLHVAAWLVAICLIACAAIFLLPNENDGIQPSPVVINSVMTSNPSACLNVDGSYYDWIELKNTSSAAVNLSGWKLSDQMDLRGAFVFGDVTIAADDTLLIYCASKPKTTSGTEIFTNFRLDSNGESLLLSDAQGSMLHTVKVPAMGAADVYQRDADTDEYQVVSYFDLDEGEAEYAAANSAKHVDGTLCINELMAGNATTLMDADGEYSDWIELYNDSQVVVDLSGYAISDDDNDRKKWVFPHVTLQPGEYRVLFASGKDRSDPSGELHANFNLSTDGETVRLYNASGLAISYIEYEAMDADASVSRLSGGALTMDQMPSPGYENTAAGARSAMGNGYARTLDNSYGLYINEVVCSDTAGDWVEIYNGGNAAVDLSNMGLSDNAARPRKWQFPNDAQLQPGGYLVVYLTGTGGNSGYVSGKYCADFALTTGERICLSQSDGTLVDSILLYDQHRSVSYGRAQGYDVYRYFSQQTPGAVNSDKSYEKRAERVKFSAAGGLQQGTSVLLALEAEAGMRIFYTTDGTEPTANSATYSTPISITANTVVKAIAWREDVILSYTQAASYIFDASHGVRLVCVSGPESELSGPNGTLNTGKKGTGYDVYVEIYEADGTQMISQDCQLELSGHGSRVDFAQKGFMLKAKSEYSDNRFRASLFNNRDYTEYKSITMRASGQDNKQTHMRDSILTSLAADTDVLYQETEVAVVYVNGAYWGVYNMRERITTYAITQFEGWSNPDDIDLIEGDLTRMAAVQGSKSDFQKLRKLIQQYDLSSDENVEKLRVFMDIENYLDYVAIQIYTANQDLNNVRVYRNNKADGKWRWAVFDLDLSYQIDRNSIKDWITSSSDGIGTITKQDNSMFVALMKNDKMRDYFLTRMGELMATTFSGANLMEKLTERYAILTPEMQLNCERWGWSVSTWKTYSKRMAQYAQNRPAKLMGYFKEAMNLSNAQMQQYFGEAIALLEND